MAEATEASDFLVSVLKETIAGDEAFAVADLEDGLRALVYPTHWQDAPRTHEFVLDTLVCHDFGEPKGQCAICGGYCNKL